MAWSTSRVPRWKYRGNPTTFCFLLSLHISILTISNIVATSDCRAVKTIHTTSDRQPAIDLDSFDPSDLDNDDWLVSVNTSSLTEPSSAPATAITTNAGPANTLTPSPSIAPQSITPATPPSAPTAPISVTVASFTPPSHPPLYSAGPILPPSNGPISSIGNGPSYSSNGPDFRVWCVARPTAPEDRIQVAMDYACGFGADCAAIRRSGPCFVPSSVISHASYAFNSYWQRTKVLGGTCDFGGTAMLITTDPSFDGCRFIFI